MIKVFEDSIFTQDLLYRGQSGLASINVQILKSNGEKAKIILQKKCKQSPLGNEVPIKNEVQRLFDNMGYNLKHDYEVYLLMDEPTNSTIPTGKYNVYELVRDNRDYFLQTDNEDIIKLL
jgi:hypothetical protein